MPSAWPVAWSFRAWGFMGGSQGLTWGFGKGFTRFCWGVVKLAAGFSVFAFVRLWGLANSGFKFRASAAYAWSKGCRSCRLEA